LHCTGKQASIQEKSKGGEVARGLRDERPNAKVIVLEEGREEPNFWNLLGGAGPIASAAVRLNLRSTKCFTNGKVLL